MSKNETELQQLRELSAALDQAALTAKLDASGAFVQVNDKFLRLLGFSHDEIAGQPYVSVLAPEVSSALRDILMGTIRRGLVWRGELAHASANGGLFWAETVIVPTLDGNQIRQFQVIAYDVSERKTVEKALSENQTFLYTLMETAPVGFFLADEAGHCSYINQTWTQMSGLRLRQARSSGWTEAIHSEDRKRITEAWSDFVERKKPFMCEYRYVQADGRVAWVVASATELQGDSKIRFLRVEQDLTERKHNEDMINAQRAHIMAASKLSALGEMAGGIAHEINNPLAIILGKAGQIQYMLAENRLDPEWLAKAADVLSDTTERIARTIKALRAISHGGGSDPFEQVAVKSLIENVLEACNMRFEEQGVRLIVDPLPETLSLDCRPGEISHILLNLISNALYAAQHSEARWIRLTILERDGFIEISVVDSGSGITPDVREKLFQPFFTTKPVGSGAGLGLSVSRSFAESHQGELAYDASSVPTRFVLKLPRTAVLQQRKVV